VFVANDKDKSGELELEEILNVGYRSKGLRMLLSPFPVQDHRVFESLIHFSGRDRGRERLREDQMNKVENTMRSKLLMSPDPVVTKSSKPSRQRPWRDPAVVSKPRAFMIWALFAEMATENTVSAKELVDLLQNRTDTKEMMERAHARGLEGSSGAIAEDAKSKLIESMMTHLLHRGFLDRLSACGQDERLSFRALTSMLWPTVPDKDITACLKWARQFQAFRMLRELTKTKDSALTNADYDPNRDGVKLDVTRDDVEALFEVLDVNGDGTLTVDELTRSGVVSVEEASRLMELWDRDRNDELQKGEIMSIIWGMNQVVRRQLKGMFAANNRSFGA